jgi:hypothetical protein
MIYICLNLDPVNKILDRQMGLIQWLEQFFIAIFYVGGQFWHIKHCLDFSFVFSAPLPAFSKR